MLIPVMALLLWLIACSVIDNMFNSFPGEGEGFVHYFGFRNLSPEWTPDSTQLVVDIGPTFLVQADGSHIKLVGYQATNRHSIDVVSPNISPDGSRIVFATQRHGENYEIAVSKLDGSDYRRLTKTKAFEGAPMWSPDGTRIVFTSDRQAYESSNDDNYPGRRTDLYIMQADGTDVRRLTHQVSPIGLKAWSPDGLTLAFVGHEKTSVDGKETLRRYIFTLGQDGSNLKRLSESRSGPAWSPDGSTIAFLLGFEDKAPSFYVINADGSGLREIVNVDRLHPQWIGSYLLWSPDGSEILAASYPFVAAMVDGTGYRVFSGLEGVNKAYASWSPNGSRIAVAIRADLDFYRSSGTVRVQLGVFTMARSGLDKRSLITQRSLMTYSAEEMETAGWEEGGLAPWKTEAGWTWYRLTTKSMRKATLRCN